MYSIFGFSLYKKFTNLNEAVGEVGQAFNCKFIEVEWRKIDALQSKVMGFEINLITYLTDGNVYVELYGEVDISDRVDVLKDDNIKYIDLSDIVRDILYLRSSQNWKKMTNEIRSQLENDEFGSE